ncbi:MAG: helix-turn-helix domain-containing protein [Armatimonadota bacterium]
MNRFEDLPDLLTVEQIAEYLQKSNQSVRAYIRSTNRPLPAIRIGRDYRIDKTKFSEWLNWEDE